MINIEKFIFKYLINIEQVYSFLVEKVVFDKYFNFNNLYIRS